MKLKIPVIINLDSGIGSREKTQLVKDSFKAYPNLIEIHKVKGDKIIPTVQKLLKKGHKIIVASGGDGTIGTVASQLVNTKAMLGVMPMGTMNNFARSLNISLELTEAANVIAKHKNKMIDVAEVNGRMFLDDSSIGIYPKIVKKREQTQAKGWHKIPSYFVALFHVFRRFPVFNVTLQIKGKKVTRRTPVVFVGNNKFKLGRKFEFGSRDRIDEGILSVFYTKKVTRMELFKLFFSIFFGTIYKEEKFDSVFTESFTIESDHHHHLDVSVDGEVEKMELPLKYKIIPKCLKVIVP